MALFNGKLDLTFRLWRGGGMQEKRLSERLVSHWRRRKAGAFLPEFVSFAPEALEDSVWSHCCVFDVQKRGNKWVCTVNQAGEQIQRAVGRDITGEIIPVGYGQFQPVRLVNKLEGVIMSAEPLYDAGHFTNDQQRIIKFRSCLLPFGRGNSVSQLVLGMSWMAF